MKFRIAASAVLGWAALWGQDAPSRSVWDGVYTEAQAKRGQPLYNQQCSSCHGDLLTGGEMAPPLAGGDFLANWTALTMGDLFERIPKTMPGTKPRTPSPEPNPATTASI